LLREAEHYRAHPQISMGACRNDRIRSSPSRYSLIHKMDLT